MKKTTLLLAICFAFQFNAMSQVLIPDANFEQRLINDGFDTNPVPDGQISTFDAEAVTGLLNISNFLIADFTGIEGFINLTGLNASYNEVPTSLDVSAIPGLTFVSVEGCILLTSLTTTGLTSLVEIQAEDAVLTALDVTTNTALQTLNLRNNSVLDLDLSLNSALVVLSVRNNGMTDLDVRNGNNANITAFNSDFNSGLTCIFVDDASASYITTLPWSEDSNSTYVNDESECNLLSVDTDNQNVFNMFPNPANNTVFVNVNMQDSQLSIYDITGKLVLNKSLNLGQNTVDVSQMASGVYLARFAANGNVQTEKLIIQ